MGALWCRRGQSDAMVGRYEVSRFVEEERNREQAIERKARRLRRFFIKSNANVTLSSCGF